MFSPDIVASDAFLEMPTSSRELYFQLGMYADDDGFVNPKKIMRMVGASDDDLKVLLTKRFLLAFQSGVVVIKHWLIHNMIRLDRYKETMYLEEKNSLTIKENKAYTELATTRQPNGNQLAPQVRLGKVRLGKVTNTSANAETDYHEDFKSIWEKYPRKVGKGAAFTSWKKAKPPLTIALAAIEAQKLSAQWKRDGGQYIPHLATWLNQKRWQDEVETEINKPSFKKY